MNERVAMSRYVQRENQNFCNKVWMRHCPWRRSQLDYCRPKVILYLPSFSISMPLSFRLIRCSGRFASLEFGMLGLEKPSALYRRFGVVGRLIAAADVGVLIHEDGDSLVEVWSPLQVNSRRIGHCRRQHPGFAGTKVGIQNERTGYTTRQYSSKIGT